MKVTVVFHGLLSDWLGVESTTIELVEDGLFSDILTEIAKQFRHRMPEPLWNNENNTFNDRVLAYTGEKLIKDTNTALSNNQKIIFYLMVAGG